MKSPTPRDLRLWHHNCQPISIALQIIVLLCWVATPRAEAQGTNSAPVFAEGAATTREVAENTAVGSKIEPAIRATDEDGDELAYTLGGSDAAAFTISQRGRLKTEAPLDYETKSSYTVTVTANDGKGGTASIAVTVNVTRVGSEPPVQ